MNIKRIFDFITSILLIAFFAPVLFIIILAIRLTSKGPAIHWSKRIGENNEIFLMPKFRTMLISAPQVATHLLTNPDQHITKVGKFLRKTSLDELPQLWSVLTGKMSFVGPRPALFNQYDLMEARTELGIHKLKPGITGWAQINGRDEISIPEKVKLDKYYSDHMNFTFDIKIIFLTAFKVLRYENITH